MAAEVMKALMFLVLVILGSRLLQQPPAPPQSTGPPGTDIYLLRLTGGLASMQKTTPAPVSTAPGYDNQPMFTPDGSKILFAANRDGKQIDIYVFDRATGRVSQLTETPENENSPTPLPTGIGTPGGFSVVRTEADKTQRLWRSRCAGAQSAACAERREAGGLSRLGGRGNRRALRAWPARHAADRERPDREGRHRDRQHRPLAASYSRYATRQLRAPRRVGRVLDQADRRRLQEN